MCIRDSACRGLEDFLLALGQRNDGNHVEQVVGLKDVDCDTCLLYTSDAADERSSVDLGGRRIIKKKKTEDNGK